VGYLAAIEQIWSEVASHGVASAIASAIMASVVAGLAFYVFRIHGPEGTDMLTIARNVRSLQERYSNNNRTILKDLRGFIIAYSSLTGLLAAALISLQFSDSTSIPTAIIYGTLGPYILRDAAYKILGPSAATSLDKTVDNIIKTKNSINQDYSEELDKIRNSDEP